MLKEELVRLIALSCIGINVIDETLDGILRETHVVEELYSAPEGGLHLCQLSKATERKHGFWGLFQVHVFSETKDPNMPPQKGFARERH